MTDRRVKVLLCCTGSVAAIKLPEIVKLLLNQEADSPSGKWGFDVKIIMTDKAQHFVKADWPYQEVSVYSDKDEWTAWQGRGDPVLHIDVTKWADVLLIAPLDANTMAKIANGICDNMLTCAVRAWDVQKPLFFCPAMNTKMWEHPITAHQVSVLKSWGYTEIPCISKMLMCGDTGLGAMAEPKDIVRIVSKHSEQLLSKLHTI